jgi:hypothetical protein
MADYRATPEDWAEIEKVERWSDPCSCVLLELRARVEALEASSKPTPNSSQIGRSLQLTPEQQEEIAALLRPNHPAKPDSSLVERVAWAGDCPTRDEARAAIREVAVWLREHDGQPSVISELIEREAER